MLIAAPYVTCAHSISDGMDSPDALAYLRKESVDIFNRLHSIREDIDFVSQIHAAYPDTPILRSYLVLLQTVKLPQFFAFSQPTLWILVHRS